MIKRNRATPPPVTDRSLAHKPSGGERFHEIWEEVEMGLGDYATLSSPDERSKEFITDRIDDKYETSLTFELNDLYQKLIPSPESYEMRLKFLAKIQHILDLEWPNRDITAHLFGSTVNGLGSLGSDVDICLTTPWDDRIRGVSNMHILA
ncbi:hypothetical protein BDK51DRAFT_32317, partial [Blyttiomyces helicus]